MKSICSIVDLHFFKFLLYNSDPVIQIHYPLFFRFFSHIDYYRLLSRFSFAIQQVPVDHLPIPYIIAYICQSQLPIPSSYPHISTLVIISLFLKSVSLFCKFFCIIFLDSTSIIWCLSFSVWLNFTLRYCLVHFFASFNLKWRL